LPVLVISITFLALAISPVFATPEGSIRIDPHSSYYPAPVMLSSPATFNISVNGPADTPTCNPHILLVMTNSSYYGLTGNVTVDWPGSISPLEIGTATGWNLETTNADVPPTGVTSGTKYKVSTLQAHLNTTEPIWWALEPFLDGAYLTKTPQEFTVTLPSTSPRMLVLALGKVLNDGCTGDLDNRVPPTLPGLVVPELATILLAAASFGAFAIYAVKRRKVPQ